MDLEHSLGNNNEYHGLWGEVVERDMYKVRDLADIVSVNDPTYVHEKGHKGIDFVPDVVFDLGANVGIFSRYTRELWPNALIIAVEPNPQNAAVFREHTKDDRIVFINKAIGKGQVYHRGGAVNGAHEVYLSENTAFQKDYFERTKWDNDVIESIMLTDLKQYITEGAKTLLKLDIEGNETTIFDDPASVEMMKTFDYIAIELHYFGALGRDIPGIVQRTNDVLNSFKETHDIQLEHIYFYARKLKK